MCCCYCRKKRKDILLKEKVKKIHKEEEEKAKPDTTEKMQESREAVKHWVVTKNRQLRANKTLFTYKDVAKKSIHEKAWRPARSLQYSYPEARLSTCKHSQPGSVATHSPNTTHSLDSYSNASFESEDSDYQDSPHKEALYKESPHKDSPPTISDGMSSSSDSNCSEGESGNTQDKVHAPLEGTGRLKSIQVCCQVVQYRCTCKDSN